MPKTKHRKQHKQKVNQFHNRMAATRNQMRKMDEMFYGKLKEYTEMSRREHTVDSVLRERPELAMRVGDALILNEETTHVQDGILRWKDDSAVFAAVETEEKLSLYTPELVNQLLRQINEKAELEKDNLSALPATEDEIQEAELVEETN